MIQFTQKILKHFVFTKNSNLNQNFYLAVKKGQLLFEKLNGGKLIKKMQNK